MWSAFVPTGKRRYQQPLPASRPSFGRRRFEAANEPKQFLVLHGHDHSDYLPKEYFDALAQFLAQLPPAE